MVKYAIKDVRSNKYDHEEQYLKFTKRLNHAQLYSSKKMAKMYKSFLPKIDQPYLKIVSIELKEVKSE